MITKIYSIAFAILLFIGQVKAQKNHTLSGRISDARNGESLIGATVYAVSQKSGTSSNEYGFYSLSLEEADSISLIFNYIGYSPQVKKVFLKESYVINIELSILENDLNVVVISAEQNNNENVENARMGVIDVPIAKIKSTPAILGEPDVLKVIQLLPGVQAGNEGTTGYYVRGGNADQNLVLLDEAVVYNPNHLFGLFSTFNTRALNNVDLIKGGFPAQYGGRLSSILDIKMKEGNNKEWEAQGGVGLISSQLTLEGPIKKDKASFIVSGRRTYLDLITGQVLEKGIETNYSFYDFNAKVNWQATSKDRLFLSAFKGSDLAVYDESKGIRYDVQFGNSAATLRWNHIFSPKVFANTSIIYNTYLQDISTKQDNSFSQTYSGINDITAKSEFQVYPNKKNHLRMGVQFTAHRFISSGRTQTITAGNKIPKLNVLQIPAKHFNEYAFYINETYQFTKRVSVNIGLRTPGFHSSSVQYNRVEPRATIKLGLDSSSSIKASYSQMNQFVHLIPNSTATLPSDIYIPSSKQTKPQFSSQYAIGYFKNFKKNQFETSIEVYYKDMDNQVLFDEGNELSDLNDLDKGLVYGKGESYGIEAFVKKKYGKISGWISYTLSWTNQQFKELNFGKTFPFRYDRRHVLSVTGSYQHNEYWTFNSSFQFSSGSAFTLPVGRFYASNSGTVFEGSYFIYEGRNNFRFAPYHRLDLSASHKKKRTFFKRPGEREWVFGLYNAYSRQNPYFIYFRVDPKTAEPQAKQVSLLPIIPSVTYNFKF